MPRSFRGGLSVRASLTSLGSSFIRTSGLAPALSISAFIAAGLFAPAPFSLDASVSRAYAAASTTGPGGGRENRKDHAAAAGSTAAVERRLILFYTAEVHGAVEPCGCTSDPLGDVSRLSAFIADARRGGEGVALVDAGSLLYPEGKISERERPSADLRAEFLASAFERMGLVGGAFGETDTAGATKGLRHLLASNLSGSPAIETPRVQRVGGVRLGVLGIADPALAPALHAKAEEMSIAAKRDVARLRKEGAEVVVLLAALDKNGARKLARESGADIVVLGKRVGGGMPLVEQVGHSFVVAPADELQRVGRLEIVLRLSGPPTTEGPALQDAGGPEANRLKLGETKRALERLRADLKKWATPADGAANDGVDQAFVAAKRKEYTQLEEECARLQLPWAPPSTGNYLVNTLVPMRRALRRDPRMVVEMKRLDQRIGAVNLSHAVPPPKPEPGRPFFVGMDKCVRCHSAASAFWKRTVHSHAWKTLVEGGKQADYKCVGCHVTGFGEVGGSTLGFTKKLESVQCETCHGPGSAHVSGEGDEEPLAIRRDTPETVCLGCHTEQHSDTFQYQAYLRDVVGAGHGLARREKLGIGPTGHELRSAALAKARLANRAMQKGDMTAEPVAAPKRM